MKKTTNLTTQSAELRRHAEEKYREIHNQENPLLSEAALQRLIHELQVHQIELELQNEELQKARAEVEEWLARYTDLYEFAPIGYFTMDREGTVSQINTSGSLMIGIERARLVGRRLAIFIEDSFRPTFNAFLEQVFESPDKQICEITLHREGSEPFWVQLEANMVEGGQECRTAMMDIQARKTAEIKLKYLSSHDALTGLYNRSYFVETMERLECGRHFPISILMADVDRMKIINDQQGHAAGDEMLKRVAQVLTISFRVEDLIARIGGDEFAVLLSHTNGEAAEIAMQRLLEVLREHNTNYPKKNALRLSVGISTAVAYGNSLMETLKKADENMYSHKQG